MDEIKRPYKGLTDGEIDKGFQKGLEDSWQHAIEKACRVSTLEEFDEWYARTRHESFSLVADARKQLSNLLNGKPDSNQRKIAKTLGVHQTTVGDDLKDEPSKPETPTDIGDTEKTKLAENSEKKIIVDIYPLKNGEKGYQVKTTDGKYYFKQNKSLDFCERLKGSINKLGYSQNADGVEQVKDFVKKSIGEKADKTFKVVPKEEYEEDEEDFKIFNIADAIKKDLENPNTYKKIVDDYKNGVYRTAILPHCVKIIKAGYKVLAKKYHPDSEEYKKNPEKYKGEFEKLQKAYEYFEMMHHLDEEAFEKEQEEFYKETKGGER